MTRSLDPAAAVAGTPRGSAAAAGVPASGVAGSRHGEQTPGNPNNTRRGKYPWGEWLDGGVRKLTRGEDFACEPASFAFAARQAAKRHGLKVTTRTSGDSVVIQGPNVEPASDTVAGECWTCGFPALRVGGHAPWCAAVAAMSDEARTEATIRMAAEQGLLNVSHSPYLMGRVRAAMAANEARSGATDRATDAG